MRTEGHAAGERAEHDQQVGAFVADEFEHFVIGDTTTGEANGPAVDFEQVGTKLTAEFFGFGIAAEDESFATIRDRCVLAWR